MKKYGIYNQNADQIDAVWANSLEDACGKWIAALDGLSDYEIREEIVAIITNIAKDEKEIKYFII